MPRYTETEFRLASNYSHRTKNGQKRRRKRSPMPRNMGNSAKGGCPFCNSKVITRVTESQLIDKYLRDNKNISIEEKIQGLEILEQPYHKGKGKSCSLEKSSFNTTQYVNIPSNKVDVLEIEEFCKIINNINLELMLLSSLRRLK